MYFVERGRGGVEIIAESVKFDVVRHDTSIRPLENSLSCEKSLALKKGKKEREGKKE